MIITFPFFACAVCRRSFGMSLIWGCRRFKNLYFRPVQYLSTWDFVLAPIYLFILINIARSYRNKKYPVGHPLRSYFLTGLYLKFAGAFFIGILYEFYYEGGDTFNYFYHSQVINSSLNESLSTWFNLLLRRSPEVDPYMHNYISQMYWYVDPPAYFVCP